MAATLQHNITTVLTKNLLTVGDNVSNVKYISIANIDSSRAAIINLFLNKGANDYYLMKNYRLNLGETLFLNKDNSLLSTILIKKNCVAIIKIKGKRVIA